MRKTLVSIFGLICTLTGKAQGGEMIFNGEKATYEIRDDRRIGPGVKYTEYYFGDIGSYNHYKMRALVVEIDNEKNNYQTPYMAKYAKDATYHNSTTQTDEFKLQKYTLGKKPVASIMAGGFTQDAANEKSVQMEVAGGLISDGIMHYMPQSGAVHYYVDGNGKVVIGKLTCRPIIKAEKAGSYDVSGYNRIRSNWVNGITVFANGYGKQGKFCTADIEGNKAKGTEVIVKLDDVNEKISSGVYKGKVIKTVSGSFNAFEEGQFVLSALQGNAEDFLKKLETGENIELDFQFYDAQGGPVTLLSAVKAFSGYAVENGKAQPSNAKGYQQDALGLSADGKKSYYIHLDQNAFSSDQTKGESNAPISIFNQFISQIDGLYEAILMDGGPSAELLVNGENVSVTYGRFIPAAMMVYSTSKLSGRYEKITASVDFKDHFRKMSVGDKYIPQYYCFNSGDDVIVGKDTEKDIKLTCDKELGDISVSPDGEQYFIAKASGKGKLYCEYKDRKDEMFVEVLDISGLRVDPEHYEGAADDAFLAKVFALYPDGTEKIIDNNLVKWSTNNPHSVASCDDGIIKLRMPGSAKVYAEYEGFKAEITIDVITGIEQVGLSAPVDVSRVGDNYVFTALDSSVCSMSCAIYSADGKLLDEMTAKGNVVTVSRHGNSSPVFVQLVIDGKKYIYKLI